MKTKQIMNRSMNLNFTKQIMHPQPRARGRQTALLAAAIAAGALLTAQADPPSSFPPGHSSVHQIGDIFVIALENHNFAQPASQNSPQ